MSNWRVVAATVLITGTSARCPKPGLERCVALTQTVKLRTQSFVATPEKAPMATPSKPLTPQQQAIVNHNTGPALVFAVAGAGKTTAMVRRIERLARDRIFPPDRILATSFSRATVQDIRTALKSWPHCADVRLVTLHALGYRVIRRAQQRGYLTRATFDSSDSSDLSRTILYQALAVARSRRVAYREELEGVDLEDFLTFIGACKGNLRYANLEQADLPPDGMSAASQAEPPEQFPWYLDLYQLYEEVRQEQGQITFDDMLMFGWELLIKHDDLLVEFRRQSECVMVDEFQDVNLAQSEILDLLTFPHRNYMAIGDDDQTIYEWRGADPRFILNFQQRYSAQVYLIDDNFRCKASQVVLANRVIEHNRKRQPKRLGLTQGFSGSTLVSFAESHAQLGRGLVHELQAELAAGRLPDEVAILVRIYAQTPYIEHFLIAANISYRIVGGVPFYQRPEVVTLLNYLRLGLLEQELHAGKSLTPEQVNLFGEAWRNVYNQPKRYLAREWSEQIREQILRQQLPLSQGLRAASADVTQMSRATKINQLADTFAWLASVVTTLPADEVLQELDERLKYREYLRESSGFPQTGEGKAANVTALIDYAHDRGTVPTFLQHLHDSAVAMAAVDGSEKDRVTITTIFRSKGLEWPVVFIPHCNEGTFPFGEPERVEEERRLLYVAITRSKLHLRVYCLKHLPISPFLREAEYRQTLDAVSAIQSSLARDPATWSKQDALVLALYPPRYHLERYFSRWWAASPDTQATVVRTIQRFVVTSHSSAALPDLSSLWQALAPARQPDPEPAPASDTNAGEFRRGDRVKHPRFGVGTIRQVSGPPDDLIVAVMFDQGEKKLALKHARLERVCSE